MIYKNQGVRIAVSMMPCRLCRSRVGVQVHHLKGTGHQSGVGMKAPDTMIMPLCESDGCHTLVHGASPEQQTIWALETLTELIIDRKFIWWEDVQKEDLP